VNLFEELIRTRFWDHQFKWFNYALRGALDIYLLKLEINQAVIDRLEPLLRQHDTKALAQRLAQLRAFPNALAAKLKVAENSSVKPHYRPKSFY
jgi:hypothetical protein